jgi:hypothetical protein
LNSRRYHGLFSVWCAVHLPGSEDKRFLAFACLSACGLCVDVHAFSSIGESVFFMSESLVVSHSVSVSHPFRRLPIVVPW